MVFWLLSMLATRDKDDMSRTLLAMSSSQESCLAMRKSGCLPLLIQILHDSDGEPGPPESPTGAKDARMRANAALHNIVFSQPDEGQAKKEMRVLHVLEQIRSYSETCWDWLQMQSRDGGRGPEGGAGTGGERGAVRVGTCVVMHGAGSIRVCQRRWAMVWRGVGCHWGQTPRADTPLLPAVPVPIEPQICQATCAIMKLSFDEEYRRAMNELGEPGVGAGRGLRPSLPTLLPSATAAALGRGCRGDRVCWGVGPLPESPPIPSRRRAAGGGRAAAGGL